MTTATTETGTTVSIYGPNIGHGGEFHVHRPGCADTRRGEYLRADRPWGFTATSRQHVVEEIYADIMAENPGATWEDYSETVRFFPCVTWQQPARDAAPVRVDVPISVEVDAQTWAETYGMVFATLGPEGAALREDIERHVRETVREAASTAMTRIAAGAVVR